MDPRQNLTNLTCKVNRLAYKLIPVEYVPTSPTGTLVVNSELYVSNNINVENCLNFVNNDNICIGIGTGTQPFGPYYPPTPYFQRSVEGPSDSWRNRALPETGTPEWEAFRAERRAHRSAAPRTDPDNNYSNITIGHDSVPTASQDLFNIAIGYEAVNGGGTGDTGSTGYFYPGQGFGNVAVGAGSAYEGQEYANLAIGIAAGYYGQGGLNTAVGPGAAYGSQYEYNVAVGVDAAYDGQNDSNVAIGYDAAYYGQDTNNIAIGTDAGFNGQTTEAIAIGTNAAASGTQQTYQSIAIGSNAGAGTSMPAYSVAIGPSANVIGGSMGYNGVAIGSSASSQRGAIVLTSNNSGLAGTTGTLYVNPLSQTTRTTNTYLMNYNTSTSQVGYKYQLDTGLDQTNDDVGVTTFSTPFATIPNVTASLLYSGIYNYFFGVTITGISTTGFSWRKFFITGTGGPDPAYINNATSEYISWIAVGITTAPPT